MRKRLAMGAFMSVVLVGLSGCPGEFLVRPGDWIFESFLFENPSGTEGGVHLYEGGSTGPYSIANILDPLDNVVSWTQFGRDGYEVFVLSVEVPGVGGPHYFYSATVFSEAYLEGDILNAETGDVVGTFTAYWMMD